MRWLALLPALTICALLPGAAEARHACGPTAAKTLAQFADTRAYATHDEVSACMVGHAPVALGPSACESPDCAYADRVTLAGHYVAWAVAWIDHGEAGFSINLASLRTGRVRTVGHAGSPGGERASVKRIVLTADGHTAWLYSHQPGALDRTPAGSTIRRDPRCGWPVVDTQQVTALRLLGAELHWRDHGIAVHAHLCAPPTAKLRAECARAGTTLVANSLVRVRDNGDQSIDVCRRGSGRTTRLIESSEAQYGSSAQWIDAIAVAGDYLAYTEGETDATAPQPPYRSLVILDTRNMRALIDEPTNRFPRTKDATLTLTGGRLTWTNGDDVRTIALGD